MTKRFQIRLSLSCTIGSIEAVVRFRSHDGYHLPLCPRQGRRTLHDCAEKGSQSHQKTRVETGNLYDVRYLPPRPPQHAVDPAQKPSGFIFFKSLDSSHFDLLIN